MENLSSEITLTAETLKSKIVRVVMDSLTLYEELPEIINHALTEDRILNLVSQWVMYEDDQASQPPLRLCDLLRCTSKQIVSQISHEKCQFDFEERFPTEKKELFLKTLIIEVKAPYKNREKFLISTELLNAERNSNYDKYILN